MNFFLSTASCIYEVFFSVSSSNMVNTGQLRSVTVNGGKLKYVGWSVGPSIGQSIHRSVRATYGIDEDADKKGLIDPPCVNDW